MHILWDAGPTCTLARMPFPERSVVCPRCGAERVTKAAKNVMLRCPSCRLSFRAPAPSTDETSGGGEPAAGDGKAGGEEPEPSESPRSSPPAGTTSSKPKVERASGVKIDQVDEPDPAESKTEPKKRSGEKPKRRPPDTRPKSKPKDDPDERQRRAKAAGRRGGRGYYERVRRGR